MNQGAELADVILKAIKSQIPKNQIIIASVTSPPPELKIKFGEIEIPSEQIYCSNYLLPNYRRDYRFEGIIDEMHQDVSEFKNSYSGSEMTKAGQGPHEHTLLKSAGSGTIKSTGNYKHHGQLWFTDTLEVGCEVLVMVVNQYFVITDRLVKMPNSAIEGGA